jgi:hypothetical protein
VRLSQNSANSWETSLVAIGRYIHCIRQPGGGSPIERWFEGWDSPPTG